jgi:hypothetical protein
MIFSDLIFVWMLQDFRSHYLFLDVYIRATNLEASHTYQLLTVGKENTAKRSERKSKSIKMKSKSRLLLQVK